MILRMLDVEEVQSKIDELEMKILKLSRGKSRKGEITMAEIEKAVRERVLHHISKGEIITIDHEERIHWYRNAPTA